MHNFLMWVFFSFSLFVNDLLISNLTLDTNLYSLFAVVMDQMTCKTLSGVFYSMSNACRE